MAPYLARLAVEQEERARSLRGMIPYRQKHPSLDGLAELCRAVLDEEERMLGDAGRLVAGGHEEDDALAALNMVKACSRNIGMIESYGMPPLHCQTEQARFLNFVLSAMHREAGLRFPCPAVPSRRTTTTLPTCRQTPYSPLCPSPPSCRTCRTFTASSVTTCTTAPRADRRRLAGACDQGASLRGSPPHGAHRGRP